VEAIVSFGQNAQVQESFPGVIHLIMKYEDDPAEALIQAVMAGGDSASRAMAVGMVLGAHSGPGAFPRKWLDGINRAKDIESLLARMG
jgi:ADP-ribosylglycohydrolase